MSDDFDLDALKAKLTARKKKSRQKPPVGISTGSTLLNLACNDWPDVGLLPGHFYFLVGDSASGKTWLTLNILAEAANHPRFRDYALIFDNAENGALMDVSRFFGSELAGRMKPPTPGPVYSHTVEEFYFNAERYLRNGPCVYVLDSMDALTTEDEQDKFTERRKAHTSGKETSGSYGTSKAKLNSSYLRVVFNLLRETGSILLIVTQTRDNIGFGAQFNPKTRGGGHALTFYASLEIWTSTKGHVKRTVKGKPRELGIVCRARVKKNRLTGKDRSVEFPILHSHGIDDLGGCVQYLIDEGHWTENRGRVTASEFDFVGSIEKLLAQVEGTNREGDLQRLVATVWQDVETACKVKRKQRYQ